VNVFAGGSDRSRPVDPLKFYTHKIEIIRVTMISSDAANVADNLVKIIRKLVAVGMQVPLELNVEAVSRAREVIQSHLIEEDERMNNISTHLHRTIELANARFQSSNKLGAIMSMRKYHKMLIDYECQAEFVSALIHLDNAIGSGVLRVDHYKKQLKSVFEQHTAAVQAREVRKSAISDKLILAQLRKCDFAVDPPVKSETVAAVRSTISPAA
jgi:hypothetical protein